VPPSCNEQTICQKRPNQGSVAMNNWRCLCTHPVGELATTEREVVGGWDRATVIAGEPDERVVVQACRLERGGDVAHRLIECGHHALVHA